MNQNLVLIDHFQLRFLGLMGRYFPFRMHPLSVAEIANPTLREEDLRDLTRVQELGQMEILSEFVRQNATKLVGYASLAKMVRVSADTIRRWTKILRSLYFHFELRPWSKNVTRCLIKEPKFYLWDWALVDDPGRRFENLLASHLLKSIHFWTDFGFGQFDLYFIRDREKREVDFLVTKNKKPWFLAEAKLFHHDSLSPHLLRFQEQIAAPHAFQVVYDMDYIDLNCFDYQEPVIVPAKTFLSQLV